MLWAETYRAEKKFNTSKKLLSPSHAQSTHTRKKSFACQTVQIDDEI